MTHARIQEIISGGLIRRVRAAIIGPVKIGRVLDALVVQKRGHVRVEQQSVGGLDEGLTLLVGGDVARRHNVGGEVGHVGNAAANCDPPVLEFFEAGNGFWGFASGFVTAQGDGVGDIASGGGDRGEGRDQSGESEEEDGGELHRAGGWKAVGAAGLWWYVGWFYTPWLFMSLGMEG
jgi:hypothetical protein